MYLWGKEEGCILLNSPPATLQKTTESNLGWSGNAPCHSAILRILW